MTRQGKRKHAANWCDVELVERPTCKVWAPVRTCWFSAGLNLQGRISRSHRRTGVGRRPRLSIRH